MQSPSTAEPDRYVPSTVLAGTLVYLAPSVSLNGKPAIGFPISVSITTGIMGVDGKPLPYVDEVLVRFVPDWSVALMELKAGTFDLVTDIAGKDVAGLKATPTLEMLERPWQGTIYFWSYNSKPGAKLAGDKMKPVRQAMQYAIDKDAVAKALGFGIGKPAYQHLSAGHIGYNQNIPSCKYDIAKAKQLLTEAGFPNGIDISLSIVSRPEGLQNAQIYKQMLDAVGAPAEHITQQDMASMIGAAREVVARSLRTLEDMGAIRIENRRVVIVNRKMLEDLA